MTRSAFNLRGASTTRWPQLAAFALAVLVPATSSAQTLEWQVVDRYRLFDAAPADSRGAVETLLKALVEGQAGGAPGLLANYGPMLETLQTTSDLRTSHWSPSERRYDEAYPRPTRYAVRVRLGSAPGEARCDWRVDGRAVETSVPCGEWTTFDVTTEQVSGDYRARALVQADVAGAAMISEAIEVEQDLYVALGDSFIAGEGNPDVPAVLPATPPDGGFRYAKWGVSKGLQDHAKLAEWWDEPCHRSLLSFPVSTTLALAARSPHRATTLIHLGCSGGEIQSGLLGEQDDLPGSDMKEVRSQIGQLLTVLGPVEGRPRIRRLLMSVGGNDVGFGRVVELLASPPNGYRFPLMPWIAGVMSTAVCPYDREAAPLSRLCGGRDTAQAHLEGRPHIKSLRQSYVGAEEALRTQLDVSGPMVIQTQYPDILRYRDPQGVLAFCRTGLNTEDLKTIADPERRAWEEEYARNHPGRVRVGFEALNGVVPWTARMRTVPYFFQLQFLPETDLAPDPAFPDEVRGGCDTTAEPSDSEVCQAYWVWSRLNREVRANSAYGWTIVGGHVAKTSEHGWCVTKPGDAAATLALPLAVQAGRAWAWNRPLADFEPYDPNLGRWFRTANDSLMTQYGGPERFHQGTVHPTFRAHLAYSDAILREAFNVATP